MRPAFYSGVSGLAAYQGKMDTIGHNLANINTAGYKIETTAFQDLLYQDMYANTEKNPLDGHGVRVVSSGIEFNQGDPQRSGGTYDFAIVGDGLFAVEKDEEIYYTRDGSFTLSADGETAYLTTLDGAYVLDVDGQRIEIENSLNDPVPDRNSESNETVEIHVETEYKPPLTEQVGVYRFPNPNGLIPVMGNRFTPSEVSGEAEPAELGTYHMLQGYVEGSGAAVLDGMMDMITAQRAFQVSARVVQAADEVEQVINNLRS